ncbi:MAG: hypothetical protein K9L66_08775 [Spirochaetaceae bacterium]|nr:hypothetical protein [Spirochaetaceae bacterium]MCF7948208.1 hypothetical protein [Spirochaetia bacterium]MCF7951587.1 hypothetical protein [Spirochaetaceae bacterium]
MNKFSLHSSFTLVLFLSFLVSTPPFVFGSEAPSGQELRLTHIARADSGGMYALSSNMGALYSENRGRAWKPINQGLPREQVWPFDQRHYRRFTSFSLDSQDIHRLAATTSTALYTSRDAGRTWAEVKLSYPVKSRDYLTAVSFDPDQPRRIYLGTSFNGLFVSEDEGRSWRKESEYLDKLYRGAGFYEEITDLTMVPGLEKQLFIASGFDNLIYRYHTQTHEISVIELPKEAKGLVSINNYSGGITDEPALEVHFQDSRGVYNLRSRQWSFRPPLLRSQNRGGSDPRDNEVEAAQEEIRAIYLNAYNVTGKRLEEHISFMKAHGFNGIVVDVKDDWGRLTYGSGLKRPAEIDAVHTIFDIEELLKKAHEEGLYIIGRMVVFKDKRLYQADNYAQALWDVEKDGPWGHKVSETYEQEGEQKSRFVQREFWTDPFSEAVWDYNIEIAEELEAMGIDEIQFDYIRFPSDGDLSTVRYRHREPGMQKTEAIESFVKKAAVELSVPVSADLYGFNSWYRMGNWIGQDIAMLADYVDVICPMYYPSHFPHQFLSQDNYIERAFELYKKGTQRAQLIVGTGTRIRPYVQAFLMGHELSMDEAEYHNYLNRQLEGILQAEGGGYTLWNNMNKYYMVNGRVSELNRWMLELEELGEMPNPTL